MDNNLMTKKFTMKQSLRIILGFIILTFWIIVMADHFGSPKPDQFGSTPCPDWSAVAAKEWARHQPSEEYVDHTYETLREVNEMAQRGAESLNRKSQGLEPIHHGWESEYCRTRGR